jgi:hypothetical protein
MEVQIIQLSKDRGVIKCCKGMYRQYNCQRTEEQLNAVSGSTDNKIVKGQRGN